MARLIGFLKVVGEEHKHTLMVRIGTSWYEMSRDANMPNGVCIYSGENSDLPHLNNHGKTYTGELSQGMVKQIMAIMQQSHSPLIQAAVDATKRKRGAIKRIREALSDLGLAPA